MFTHTGPRRGDVFAESSFAKQIAMVEAGMADCVYHGNLDSLRTIADVRDAVRAYHMLLTVNPVRGAVYNIGGEHTCKVGEILDDLICLSRSVKIRKELDPNRVRPLDADLQVPDCTKFKEATGWKPEISYQQTLQDLMSYWRSRVASGSPLLPR
jgi:GDPmannose 4,6-dehydratase